MGGSMALHLYIRLRFATSSDAFPYIAWLCSKGHIIHYERGVDMLGKIHLPYPPYRISMEIGDHPIWRVLDFVIKSEFCDPPYFEHLEFSAFVTGV